MREWFRAAEFSSMHESIIPVIIAAALAAREDRFSLLVLCVTLVCAVCLHIACNLVRAKKTAVADQSDSRSATTIEYFASFTAFGAIAFASSVVLSWKGGLI